MNIKPYIAVFKNAWQYALEYRLNLIIRLLIAFISLISIYFLWNDIFVGKAELMGYTKEQIVTYYIIVGYLFASIFAGIPVEKDIREGSLSIYLTKPINYIGYIYWQSLAQRVFRLVIGFPVLLLIFVIFKEHLFFVTSIQSYLILLVTAFSAINILFLIDLLVGFIEFWVFYSNSLNTIVDVIVSFFAGTLIPIVFLPSYIQTMGDFLPFKYTGVFIIESFLGRITGVEVLWGMLVQIVWTVILLVVASVIWRAGLRRYEAVGA